MRIGAYQSDPPLPLNRAPSTAPVFPAVSIGLSRYWFAIDPSGIIGVCPVCFPDRQRKSSEKVYPSCAQTRPSIENFVGDAWWNYPDYLDHLIGYPTLRENFLIIMSNIGFMWN